MSTKPPSASTKERLVNSVISLLETKLAHEISVEMVIQDSGISNGSLYHHFSDLQDLIDRALVVRFSTFVDNSVAMLQQVSQTVTTKDELIAALRKVTRATQSSDLLPIRSMRIWTLGQTTLRTEFKDLLGVEQERLTEGLADLTRFAQEKGWYRADLDPRAMAVFIQSYTIGKYVDDITSTHMSEDSWVSLIDSVIESVFIQ